MREKGETNLNNSNKQDRTASNSLNKYITIEDLEANPWRHVKITSPRSIIALKNCGIVEDELYQISFNEYKGRFHETKSLPIDIQLSRYQFYEARRIEKINKVKAKRDTISLDDDNINNILFHSQYNSFNLSNSYDMNLMSNSNSIMNKSKCNLNSTTLLSKDIKELEMMRKKSESEMLSIIQSELHRISMIKESERKASVQKERFSRSQEEQRLRKEEEERVKKEKEVQRLKRQEEEEEKQNQLKKELERKAEEKELKEQLKEKQREEELKQKRVEESEKQKLFQEKIRRIHNDNQSIIDQKQQLLLTREECRQFYIEQQRSIKQITQIQKSKSKREKIDKNRMNLEEQKHIIHDLLLKNQQIKESKMEKFELQQSQLHRKKRDLSLQKQIEIQNVLERNKEIEKQQIIEFDKKQERIERKKILFEKMLNEEKDKIKKENEAKAEHIKMTLLKNERQEIARKEYLLNKRKGKDELLQNVMNKKKMESIAKSEELNKKHYLIEDNSRMIARVHEFDIEKVKIKQDVKNRRIDEFMKQKSYMIDRKRALKEELSKIKHSFFSRLHDVTTIKQLDSTTIESFRDIFPDNPNFDRLVQQSNHQDKMNGFFFTNSGFSRPIRISKEVKSGLDTLYPDDINANKKMKESHSVRSVHMPLRLNDKITFVKERVNAYRCKLNQELLLLIQEERQKEMEREKVMSNSQSAIEKKRFEELFGQERGKASIRITRLNE